MALVLKDRVKETCTGTAADMTFTGAVSGFAAFSVIGDTNETYYIIEDADATKWEVGIGTYTLSGTTFSRDTILANQISGTDTTKQEFSSGVHTIYCVYPAGKSVNLDASGNLSHTVVLTTDTSGNYVATVTGGTGITSTGATSGEGIAHSLSVDASQTQITSVGTIATGDWEATDVAVAHGGTGSSTAGGARTNLGITYANIGTVDISANTNLAGGTGITLTDDTLSTTDSEIVHDNLSGFVANEHIDHSSVSIASGTGLSGGGDLTSTRTLTVDASQTQITSVGIIGVGTWEGTTIAVDQGGTGTTTLDNLITLGDHTTGNYVATIAGTSNEIEVSGSGSETSAVTIGLPDDVTIAGDLTVNGTTTTVNSTTLSVADPLIILASGNDAADSVDIGLYGLYDTSGSLDLYAGLFRDASDSGKFKLFKDLQDAPTTTVDVLGTGYAVATLVANIEGALAGNATTATSLAATKTIGMTGDVVWTSAGFDGSGNVTGTATIQPDSVALTTDTTGNYVQQGATSGSGLSGSVNSEGGTFTVTSNATNDNTASTIVFRDGSGDFSAGTITAALTGNADTATLATDATSVTVSANNGTDETVYPVFVDGATGSQGAETDTGLTYNPSSGLLTSTLFAGDITGDVTGNADTATALADGRTIGMTGHVVWTSASFTGAGNVTGTATIQALSVDNSMLAGSIANAKLVNDSVTVGTTEIDLGTSATTLAGLASVTSTAFVGDITGDVTGNAVTATTATNVIVSDSESDDSNHAITFVDDLDGSTSIGIQSDGDLHYNPSTGTITATLFSGTLTTAAQANITSVGTLTALQVDNISVDGNTISTTAGTDLNITPLADQQIVLDGTIVIDAGVVTGATSITSTAFVGALTGNADTVTNGVYTTDLGSNVLTFLGTPSSSNLAAAITDETGTGALVFADTPTLIAPALGTPSALVATNASGTAANLTAGKVTVSDSAADTAFPVAFHDESNALLDDTGAFTYNPTGSVVTATSFVGALTGNATTVTNGVYTGDIGSSVQPHDAQLDTLAALTAGEVGGLVDLATLEKPTSDGQFIVATGDGVFAYESGATARTSIGLGSVENTTLSIWAGTTNITTLGTVTGSATWNATAIGATYLPVLNSITAPTGDVSLNSNKITSLTDPTAAQDAATKSYVDAIKSGLDIKDSCVAATTVAGTLASSFKNGDVIDGVTLVTNERILIKDQTDGSENGIYTVNASGAPTRATDFDTSAEVTSGAFTFVEEGTVNSDAGLVLTTNDPITVGSTSLTFTQFSGAGQITAGDGLTKSGNTIDAVGTSNKIDVSADAITISPTYVGQGSITTVGALTSGSIATGFGNIVTANTLDISGGTLTTSAAQNLAIVQGAGANIDIGTFSLTANTLVSDVATGTSPLTVSSTTVVANLNADLLDGQEGSYYLDYGNFAIDDDEIPIAKLASDTVNYGGVEVTLGASDTTPAFALADATGLPIVAGTTGTLSVARGGTGATTLTDGGVLLGNGTGAVVAMAVLADGEIIVGDGTTDPVALAAFSSSTGTLNVASGGTGATTLDNLITLGTHTTGNYVATIAGTSNEIEVSGSGSETAAVTIGLPNDVTIGDELTVTTAILPDAVGGADMGSATAEWGDIYIADDKKIKFGNDQDATIEYDEDGTDMLVVAGSAVKFEEAFIGAASSANTAAGSDPNMIITLDLATANFFRVQLGDGEDIDAINFTNPVIGQTFLIRFEQPTSGTKATVTWADLDAPDATNALLNWPGGSAPTLTETNSKSDMIGFVCVGMSPGSIYSFDGFIVGQNI